MTGTVVIPDMPSLHPDELLHSLLGRLLLLNPFGRPRNTLRDLIGGHVALVGVDLTVRLAELHERLGDQSPTHTAVELLERSTLYPYHRAFLPRGRSERLLQAQLHGAAAGLKAAIGLCANRFGAATSLRYCPQCVREDRSKYGIGHWRRAHHLPGVMVCARHHLQLVDCGAPSHSGNKHALALPPWSTGDLVRLPGASEEQVRFAALSADALNSHRPAADEVRRAAVYRTAAVGMGLAGVRARIDYGQLASALLTHHRQFNGFEHRTRLLATAQTPLAWLRPLFTRPERALHPICHLVVIDFLFGTWQKYEDALTTKVSLPSQLPADLRFGDLLSSARGESDCDPVLDTSLSCRQAAEKAGLCVTTVAARRRAAGLHVASRRKSFCGPVVERVRALILQGLSPALIAERTGVSMSTAYRLRREHQDVLKNKQEVQRQALRQERREAWVALKAENLTVKVARQHGSACYAWLRRHDRDWLVATNARFAKVARSSHRVDWAARDSAWSARVEPIATAWHAQRPRSRLSKSAVFRGLGQWTARAHRDKLPITFKRIDELTQTRRDFQHARMTEAIDSLSRDGARLLPARVLKCAGLRKLPRPIVTGPFPFTDPHVADDDHSLSSESPS